MEADDSSHVEDIECMTTALMENRADFETSNDVSESSNDQNESKRPILRATRKMARRHYEHVTVTAEEVPKRVRFIDVSKCLGVYS